MFEITDLASEGQLNDSKNYVNVNIIDMIYHFQVLAQTIGFKFFC